jgi:pimeloyl-ACP methyl ester carboxylesterase
MFILIHGANHSSRCWEPMIDHLNAPVLAIDLPGRGRHGAPLDQPHLSDFIESAVADIEEAGLRDAILVGHSMAGLSIPGIVDRVHDRLRQIALRLVHRAAARRIDAERTARGTPRTRQPRGSRSCRRAPRQEADRPDNVLRHGRGANCLHARRSRRGDLLAPARPRRSLRFAPPSSSHMGEAYGGSHPNARTGGRTGGARGVHRHR